MLNAFLKKFDRFLNPMNLYALTFFFRDGSTAFTIRSSRPLSVYRNACDYADGHFVSRPVYIKVEQIKTRLF